LFCFCSAVVSGAEVALFSLSQKDLDESMQTNATKVEFSQDFKANLKLLATLLVINNFINIAVVILFSFIGGAFAAITSPVLKFILKSL
jgi:Mg2+/Co2+ transporter CorB